MNKVYAITVASTLNRHGYLAYVMEVQDVSGGVTYGTMFIVIVREHNGLYTALNNGDETGDFLLRNMLAQERALITSSFSPPIDAN